VHRCCNTVLQHFSSDLQQLVHKNIVNNFSSYPSKRIWGLTKPDKNIYHRRVPNLQTFFKRHGKSFPLTNNAKKNLPGNLPHIGIVSDNKNEQSVSRLIIHNIGRGPEESDMLFSYKITGHYRYEPPGYGK
jgi:uncharacterized protein YijF (DUF1287 family)